tara:strand:- start:77 stop:373 length:297 start_codon:yes stop_codon:yes gene_type:complete
MKMTIVLDTDDLDGLKDAQKIATMLLNKHGARDPFYSRQASFGKIQLIKLMRAFAVDALAHMEEEGAPNSAEIKGLRFTKKFVDARWDQLSREVLTTS